MNGPLESGSPNVLTPGDGNKSSPPSSDSSNGDPPPSYKSILRRSIAFGWINLLFTSAFTIPLGIIVVTARSSPEPFEMSLGNPALIPLGVAVLLASILSVRSVNRRGWISWRSAGFVRNGAAMQSIIGLAIGIGSFALVPLFALPFGWVHVDPSAGRGGTVQSLLLCSVVLLPLAAAEEIICRGPLLTWWGRRSIAVAVLATAVFFAVLHLPNDGFNAIAFLEILIAGIGLAIARFRSGALWLPIGWHFGWNLAQAWLFGFVVSGWAPPTSPFLSMRFSGPPNVTGGAFGPESGLLSCVAGVIALLVYAACTRRSRTGPASVEHAA